jgi:hypothetical protein
VGVNFSTATNVASCTPLTTCALGTYVSNLSAISATVNRVCTACPAGYFNATTINAPNASSCVAYTPCTPGSYVSTAGTTAQNQACSVCPAGSYSANNNQTACTAGTYTSTPDATVCASYVACPIGSKITVDGTASAPPTCVLCPAGQTSVAVNSHECVPTP